MFCMQKTKLLNPKYKENIQLNNYCFVSDN